jgi:hypothetical protein
MTASVINTIKSVFPTVEVYPIFSQTTGDGVGNIAILAYEASFNHVKDVPISAFPVDQTAQYDVGQYLERQFQFSKDVKAIILSDDYNPIDFYDVWLKEAVRKAIVKNIDWDIML